MLQLSTWFASVARLLAGFWTAWGIWGMASFFSHSGFKSDSVFPWIALAISALLTGLGSLGLAGNRWGNAILLVPVSCVCIYATGVCYAHLFHGRFPMEFWLMLGTIFLGIGTALITPFIFALNKSPRLPPMMGK
jgi:hypothetical protein